MFNAKVLFVNYPCRPRIDPGKSNSKTIAPVLPVMCIASFFKSYLYAFLLKMRNERAIFVNERFVHAAANKNPFCGHHAVSTKFVHEFYDRIEYRAALVATKIAECERS